MKFFCKYLFSAINICLLLLSLATTFTIAYELQILHKIELFIKIWTICIFSNFPFLIFSITKKFNWYSWPTSIDFDNKQQIKELSAQLN